VSTLTVDRLAGLLEYPGPDLVAIVRECRGCPELDRFLAEIEDLPPGRLEELYSSAFDLDAAFYPYVGHHLLGETYRRSRFMVGLLDRYAEHGFEPDRSELPDHLVVLLRFLAHCEDDELCAELVGEAILPAIERMTRDGRNVYVHVLNAIRAALADLWPEVEPCTYEPVVAGGLV
jgi:nitrate reductase delta subunit